MTNFRLQDKRLLEKVIKAVERFNLFEHGDRVLLAVSGGPDSVFLALAVNSIASKYGLKPAIAHFNHKLRGIESDADAKFVEQLADSLGWEFHLGEGDVKSFAKENQLSVEQAARELRYKFLKTKALEWNAQKVALGHTRSDSAETVLLNLLRGAGLRGAGGIPPKRDIFVRPLILLSRNEIIRYLQAHKIPYRVDSSNFDTRITRNFIRLKVFPLLEQRFKKFEEHLANFGLIMREVSTSIEPYVNAIVELVKKSAPEGEHILNRWMLLRIEKKIRTHVYQGIGNFAEWLDFNHIEAIEAALRDGGMVELPNGWKVESSEGDLRFFREDRSFDETVKFEDEGTHSIDSLNMIVSIRKVRSRPSHPTKFEAYFPTDSVRWPIVVRRRREGDRIRLRFGMRPLKKLFIDMKIPRWRRDLIPIFEDRLGILWAAGIAAAYRLGKGRTFIKLEVRRKNEGKFWIYDNG